VDLRSPSHADVPATVSATGEAVSPLACLQARAVLVDTEEGVVRQLLRSPLGELFSHWQSVTGVSGAGNNWAHGWAVHGPAVRSATADLVRRALEPCDSPQALLFLHSLGGGTGSGLGSYLLEQCADDAPGLFRLSAPVMPAGASDAADAAPDVVTAPYNCVLALRYLADVADAVFPVDNGALASLAPGGGGAGAGAGAGADRRGSAFDSMNGLVAQMVRQGEVVQRALPGVHTPGAPGVLHLLFSVLVRS
jgi:tubulin epsilon